MHTSPFSPARPPAAPLPPDRSWVHRLCRSLWWWVTAVLTTVGAGAAFVLLGVVPALVLLSVGTAGTTLVRYQVREASTLPWRPSWPAVLDLLGGWCLLAVVGLAAEFSASGIVLSAVVIAVRAVPLRRKRHPDGTPRARTRTPPLDVPPAELIPCDPLPQPAAVTGLSTAEVCWAWRMSYVGMHRPDCPGYQLQHLSALRAACLDELEQRDPVAFRRWLPTARAAGDPARFFCPPQHH